MYVRCPECRATNWIQLPDSSEDDFQVSCKRCQASYPIRDRASLGPESQQTLDAQELADTNRIDLPSAYSVLLGISTLEQAAARPAKSDGESSFPSRAAVLESDSSGPRFDPGFKAAVDSGRMTVAQAMERGNRDVWAQRLAILHGMAMETAYRVADNEVALRTALHETRAAADGKARERVAPKSSSSAATWLLVAAGLVVAIAAVFFRGASSPPSTSTDPALASGSVSRGDGQSATRVERDADERVVRVEGSKPEEVLEAFCKSIAHSERYRPREVVASIPPFPNQRLGLLDDSTSPDTLLAISIRRDRSSGMWIAGNGVQPVAATVAPTAALTTQTD